MGVNPQYHVIETPGQSLYPRSLWQVASTLPPGRLRLLLATIVMVAHFSSIAIGTAAVNLFFALSGYWVYRLFDNKYAGTVRPGLTFMASRILRLLPVFLLFNLFAIALQAVVMGRAPDLSIAALLPNFLILGYADLAFRPLVPAWSLDIEMQFYLLFAMVVRFIRVSKTMFAALVLTALAAGGLYISFVVQDSARNVLPYSGFFLLGVFAAKFVWRPPAWMIRLSLLVAFAALPAMLAVPDLRGILMHNVNSTAFAWNAAANFVLSVLLAPMAIASVRVPSNRADRLAGDLSYIVYCCHWPAVVLAGRYLAGTAAVVKAPAVGAIIAVIFGVSMLVLLYFDRPIGRWREHWVDRQLKRGAP